MTYSGKLQQGEVSVGSAAGLISRQLGISITWDASQAQDPAKRRYQTFAQVLAALAALEDPTEVYLKGNCLADVAGTYDWSKITLKSNDELTTLVGSEGVVLKDVSIDARVDISSLATTTNFLSYSENIAPVIRRAKISGSATRGCIASLSAVSGFQIMVRDQATLSTSAFETTNAIQWYIRVLDAEWEAGSGGHIIGTLGTLFVYRNFETADNIELDVWGGVAPTYFVTERLNGVAVTGTPAVGYVPTATSATTATWQAPGGGSGRLSTLTWDAANVTDAPNGSYQTFAEIVGEIGTLKSPITVIVKGAAVADVVGTYEYENVHFVTDEPATTLAGDEGVVIRNARFSGPMAINTNATTTHFLEYTTGKSAQFDGPTLTGVLAVGLFRADHAGAFLIDASNTEFGSYAYEQTQATSVTLKVKNSKFTGTSQFWPTNPFVTGSITIESDPASQLESLDISQWQGGLVSYDAPATAAGDLEDGLTLPTVGRVRGAFLAQSGMSVPVGAVLVAGFPDIRHAPVATTGGNLLLPRLGSSDIVRWGVDANLQTRPNYLVRLNVDVGAEPAELKTIVEDGTNLWYVWFDGSATYQLRRVNALIERSDFSVGLSGFNDGPGEMVWHAGSNSFWIIDTDGTQVVKVELPNPLGTPTITAVPLGSAAITGIVADGPYVYVTADAGQVFQIVAATAVPTGFAIGGGGELMYPGSVGAGYLWVGGDSETVFRLDATTMAIDGSFTTADTGLKRVCYQAVGVGPEALYVLNSSVSGVSIRRILTPQGAMSAGAERIVPSTPTPPEVMVLVAAVGRLIVPLTDDRYGKLFVSRTDTSGDPVTEPSLEPSDTNGYPAGGRLSWSIPKAFDLHPMLQVTGPVTFNCNDEFIDAKPPVKVLQVDSSGGAVTIELPFGSSNGLEVGDTIVVKDADGSAGTNSITVTTQGGAGTIDGQVNQTISTNWGSLTLVCTNPGANAWVILLRSTVGYTTWPVHVFRTDGAALLGVVLHGQGVALLLVVRFPPPLRSTCTAFVLKASRFFRRTSAFRRRRPVLRTSRRMS